MTISPAYNRYIYWLDDNALTESKQTLQSQGYKLSNAKLTPCEVLKASGQTLVYAKPSVWSRMCKRQGSWYRESERAGKTLLVSDHPLPEVMHPYLDAQLSQSDFQPDYYPTKQSLQDMVDSREYLNKRPDDWEDAGIKDGIMFKVFFTFTRFWGLGDNLPRHWLAHRANHANFLTKTFTTEIDGENVAYTVTDNKGVCSSCVEFFNVTSTDSRKLVNACPGAVTFANVKRNTYYDMKPIKIPVVTA